MGSQLKRAVFLDRDGTLNRRPADHDYVRSATEFVWLPEAREGVARLARIGFVLLVVSNQRGVARGLVEPATLSEIERRIQQDLEPLGTRIEAFKYCMHDDADDCDCRKPKPGLIVALASELEIDLERSWMIGDTESDVVAGQQAGCRTVLIAAHASLTNPDYVASSLAEASLLVLGTTSLEASVA